MTRTSTELDIRGSGTSWVITRDGIAVSRTYSSNCNAVAALRGVEQRLDPNVTRLRRCRCGESFLARRGEVLCAFCRPDVRRGNIDQIGSAP